MLEDLCGKVTLLFTPGEEFCDMDYRRSLIADGKLKYPSGKQEMIYEGVLTISISCCPATPWGWIWKNITQRSEPA